VVCFVIFPENVPELEGIASLFLSLGDCLAKRAECDLRHYPCQIKSNLVAIFDTKLIVFGNARFPQFKWEHSKVAFGGFVDLLERLWATLQRFRRGFWGGATPFTGVFELQPGKRENTKIRMVNTETIIHSISSSNLHSTIITSPPLNDLFIGMTRSYPYFVDLPSVAN